MTAPVSDQNTGLTAGHDSDQNTWLKADPVSDQNTGLTAGHGF